MFTNLWTWTCIFLAAHGNIWTRCHMSVNQDNPSKSQLTVHMLGDNEAIASQCFSPITPNMSCMHSLIPPNNSNLSITLIHNRWLTLAIPHPTWAFQQWRSPFNFIKSTPFKACQNAWKPPAWSKTRGWELSGHPAIRETPIRRPEWHAEQSPRASRCGFGLTPPNN